MRFTHALLILVAIVAARLLHTVYVAGVGRDIQPHLEGSLQMMYTQMPGTEDLDVDYERGLLFVSSTDRRKTMAGQPGDGGIWILNLSTGSEPQRLAHTYAGEFNPHGISLLKKDSLSWLFVVNHNPSGNFVERFAFRNDTLFHEQTYSNEAIISPNDVVAVDIEKFYFTNDHSTSGRGLGRMLEDYFRIPFASLVYFNGKDYTTVVKGLHYANGVNVSRSGTMLYLAETTGRTISVFVRDSETGLLTKAGESNLGTGVDNIHVDDEGVVWVGAHPNMLAFAGHAKDPARKSPSQLLRLVPRDFSFEVDEVYLDDGNQLSGSSVVVPYKGEIFAGVVFENKVLRAALR